MQDALDEIARQKPRDVFKPLRVHFIGEDGIDAGGVKKEFFQLLVTELLCPDYGMLIFQPVRTSPSSPLPPHCPPPLLLLCPPPLPLLACPSPLLPFPPLVSSSLRSMPLSACAMPPFDSLCVCLWCKECGALSLWPVCTLSPLSTTVSITSCLDWKRVIAPASGPGCYNLL